MENSELSLPGPASVVHPASPADPAHPAGADPFAQAPRARVQAGRLRRRAGIALAALAAVVAKFFAAIKGAVLLLPKLKLLTTAGTALVSVAAYSLWFGWSFAVGFVVLLFVHEMGHVIQLRREGIKASAPTFVPFLGAFIAAKSLGRNALAEARVGLAGPVLGTVGALACLALGEAIDSDLLRALAYIGFFLNLFNLLPVVPLDGGRAMAALSPWMWIAGYALLIAVAIAFPSPIMLLIALFGGLETWRRWQARKSPEGREFHRVRPVTRAVVAGVYVALALALAVGMDLTFVEHSLSDV